MPGDTPLFISMPGALDGVEVSPIDGLIHVNTMRPAAGMDEPDKGGIWRLTKADFRAGRLPKAFAGDFGALDGLVFTALRDAARHADPAAELHHSNP
jgi:hypothetical protein